MRHGRLHLSAGNDKTDRSVIREVFLRRCYAAGYGEAIVVDVGAHKGYFGAYALSHGAALVVSYEPERENYRYLQRTAGSFSRPWVTHQAAVDAEDGEAVLCLHEHSWAHSLLALDGSTEWTQPVRCVAMRRVLEDAATAGPDRRLVVKVDAEGAETGIVLGTPPDVWGLVDEAFIEVHDFAICTAGQVAVHLEAAGLKLVSVALNVLHVRRPFASAPTASQRLN